MLGSGFVASFAVVGVVVVVVVVVVAAVVIVVAVAVAINDDACDCDTIGCGAGAAGGGVGSGSGFCCCCGDTIQTGCSGATRLWLTFTFGKVFAVDTTGARESLPPTSTTGFGSGIFFFVLP